MGRIAWHTVKQQQREFKKRGLDTVCFRGSTVEQETCTAAGGLTGWWACSAAME
jgi:phage-related minor tail protein